MKIANNVGSLIAQNRLSRSSSAMSSSLEKLSTGLKVNRGADGPAALVISEKQRAQIAGIEQAIENTDKAVSVVQTAEGALNEVNSLLVKIRSLALDSANSGVNDTDALAANQKEIDNALETITRIADSTQFSTKKLLNGEAGVVATAGDTDVTAASGTVDTADGVYDLNVTTVATRANQSFTQAADLSADETLTVNGVSITLTSGSTQAEVAERINAFTDQTGVTAEVDGANTRLRTDDFGTAAEIVVTTDGDGSSGTTGIGSGGFTANGTDIVVEVTKDGTSLGPFNGVGNTVTVDAGDGKGLSATIGLATGSTTTTETGAQGNITIQNNSLAFQIGANANQSASIAISKVDAETLGLSGLNIESEEGAQAAIAAVDAAIDQVTNDRGELGAFQQNTLESTANNLRTSLENSVNAESVIRDTDYAKEIAEFTKQQVLVQAGTSLLGSANQTSQLVLSLL